MTILMTIKERLLSHFPTVIKITQVKLRQMRGRNRNFVIEAVVLSEDHHQVSGYFEGIKLLNIQLRACIRIIKIPVMIIFPKLCKFIHQSCNIRHYMKILSLLYRRLMYKIEQSLGQWAAATTSPPSSGCSSGGRGSFSRRMKCQWLQASHT